MIDSILLVDDEDLFHLVFEDACSLLDITLSLESLTSADEAENLFKEYFQNKNIDKPECVFVDLNIIGSSFDGIELIRKINFKSNTLNIYYSLVHFYTTINFLSFKYHKPCRKQSAKSSFFLELINTSKCLLNSWLFIIISSHISIPLCFLSLYVVFFEST